MNADFALLLSKIPDPLALAGAFLVVGFLVTRLAFRDRPVGRFLCQLASFAGFTSMLLVARVIPFEATPKMDWTLTYVVSGALKIVWWLAASWLLSGFFRAVLVYKRQARETRLLQDLIAGFIYVCAVLAIIGYVFDIPVSGVLAASGVIAIVLGLALQNTLGDVFSGIVLNLAKPYHPGDWVILDGSLQGRVIETNWRATQILTDSNDLASVPNSIVAKAKLVNASRPTLAHGLTIIVRLDPATVPSRGCSVLQTALLSCNRILRVPVPSVTVRSLDAVALECEVQFFVTTIEDGQDAQNEVYDLVFRLCRSEGIRLAPPAGSPFALPPGATRREPADAAQRLLDHLPIFAPLSDDERATLAPKMTRRIFKAGDVLIEQGIVAQALFILSSGVLVALQSQGSEEGEVTRLAPGDCFGQAGVLTGTASMFKIKALTKALVYEIAKDDLTPLLKEIPAIAAELGQTLARREAVGKSILAELAPPDKNNENFATRLADRVKDLFGLD
ncbi:cyclic nucleotide-binding domain-containing protein [Telmatospirillum siberiense]|uniref:Small-conductance mechanosensitive channel n=1 Tax=Telmatospirillum siberiense TaxID=382514 RepID=A0A2N3PRK2_9PROT|nr:mechanosensitive ion channel family protein [Telmatospirillum siberiense]PKU23026.1 mechanosensitive ion channel protein [Telmatospirillum siberiense]